MHGHHGEHEQGKCECVGEEHAGHMGYEQGEMGSTWPGHMRMMGKMCWGHKHKHGMMGGMGMCPICGQMMGGMWPGHMGMMGKMCRGHGHHHGMMGGKCPICKRMMGMEAGEEEGPYRGKGPVKRTDEQIKAEVEQTLTDNSWLDASNVQVSSVQEGVVTLTGTVDSRDSKRRAEDLADEVLGVKDVQNNLQIQSGG